jgi:Tol biopolymer transport system component
VTLFEELEQSVTPSTPAGPRIAAAIVALLLTFASFAFATDLFGRVGSPSTAAVGNGKIAFQAFDGSTWQIFASESDGTGLVQLTHVEDPELAADPAWSPDGSRLAYVVQGSDPPGTGPVNIWVMDADGTDARAVTDGPGWRWNPAWSPDGTQIAFIHHYDVHVMDADGTNDTNLMPQPVGPGAFEPTWSPDGETIAFVGREADDDLYVMRSDGSDVRTLFSDQGYQREIAWSPDGSKILFANVTEESGSDVGELSVIDPRGTRVSRLSNLPRNAQAPTWSPDGSQIAFMANDPDSDDEALYLMNADGTGVHKIPGLPMNASWPAWQPVPMELEPSPSTPSDVLVSSSKANGTIYFSVDDGDGTSQIQAVEPDGSDRRVAFEGVPLSIAQVAWSPDGTRIAYRNQVAEERGIYIANPDGTEPVRLTDGANDGWPTWSPDGAQIAFSSTGYDPSIGACTSTGDPDLGCPTDIYVMDSDGSDVTRLTTSSGAEYQPDWSPDGTRIAFTHTLETWIPTAVHVIDVDGSGSRQVSSRDGGSDFAPSWSPDGSRLVFAAIRYEDWGIFVVNADGTGESEITFEGESGAWSANGPVWAPDGSSIAAVCRPGGDGDDVVALCLIRPDGTTLTSIAEVPPGAGDIAWQPIVGSSESPIPTESPTPDTAPIRPRVTATISVGAFPRAVAVGEGAVWATVDNANGGPDDHLLLKIDLTTNEILETVPMPEVGDLAAGSGALWTTSWEGGESVLLRIDPATTEVDATIPLGSNASNVEVGFDGVWVTVTTEGDGPAGEVLRIDPVSNEIVARISIDGGWPRDVVVGEGSVWVYGHSKLEEHGWVASSLWRIDPVTNELMGTVLEQNGFLGDGSYLPDDVSVAEGWVWAADDRGNGLRIDPATGASSTFEVHGGFAWPFLAYEGHIFFGLEPVRILDTGTLEVVASVALDSQVADAVLDPATGTLWIANYERSVTRIDLS